jgi:ribonuclease P protein component
VQPLSGRQAFSKVLDSGVRRNRGPLTIIINPNDLQVIRVGLVVGRRIGGAVARNRARRRIRHALVALDLAVGFDFVVIARPGVADVAFQELVDGLRTAVAAVTQGAGR